MKRNERNSYPSAAISSLAVRGFKSISDKQSINVRPLTLLSGVNSSGKSSMMQPLLLLKQTLEAPYDPGPLLLNGPNVRFTSSRQFCPASRRRDRISPLLISIGFSNGSSFTVILQNKSHGPIELASNILLDQEGHLTLSADTTLGQFVSFANDERLEKQRQQLLKSVSADSTLNLSRERFFARPLLEGHPELFLISFGYYNFTFFVAAQLQGVIHVPAIRRGPERSYLLNLPESMYPGTFDNYVAGLIFTWSSQAGKHLDVLSDDLRSLGLTGRVEAKQVDDTQAELRVGRLSRSMRGNGKDMVSIADVGFGVSQTLPVVVALHAAKPGQLVYIEQPEIHLHPRAQVAMARLLVNAANRGVRVVAETHSSLILLAVQTLVAEGVIPPGDVGLNWFMRSDKDGTTQIQTAELDMAGRFGDWPEDFDEVTLEAENRYLSAAEARLSRG